MTPKFRTFSFLLILPLFAFALNGALTRADDKVAEDDSIKSVYIVPRTVKGTEEDAKNLKSKDLESIEIKFYTKEARSRGGLYFEAVHHVKGKDDSWLGGSKFTLKDKDNKDVVHYGMNYDDYQYSTGLLKKDFDAMWGKWIYARNGASVLATGTTVYMMWGLATYLSKKEIFALSGLAAKAVELYKSKIGFAIMIYPTYLAVKEIYNFYNETQNSGKFVPGWDGFKGREMAERDWLFRVLSQAYENANHNSPIDTKQFDIEAGKSRIDDILNGKKAELPDPEKDKKDLAAQPRPAVNTVPMKKDLNFAESAMSNFFSKYYEDNAEDVLPPQAIPAAP